MLLIILIIQHQICIYLHENCLLFRKKVFGGLLNNIEEEYKIKKRVVKVLLIPTVGDTDI